MKCDLCNDTGWLPVQGSFDMPERCPNCPDMGTAKEEEVFMRRHHEVARSIFGEEKEAE